MEYSRREMLQTYSKLISIKAISPASGGEGEGKRADYLEGTLRSWGLRPKRYTYIDNYKVERPSIVVKYGNVLRTLWILAHADTVSEGDISLWKTDPFKGVIKNGKIYGRGTRDDGSGVIAGMYALKSLLNAKMRYNFGLVLVADEEVGSRYGIQKLLREKLFKKGDLFIVPDLGSSDGRKIEIAEKSILWLRVTVLGKQVHASTPQKGINAFREAASFMLDADRYLHRKYNRKDKLYTIGSTFEMTKHEKNLESTNIIPGKEVFYFDFRVLPEYRLDSILSDLNRMKRKYRARIKIEIVQREDAATKMKSDSETIRTLKKAIESELHLKPALFGTGGGTVAKYLREDGFDAAVWMIDNGMSHQPNEYAKIEDVEKMIRVFRRLFV